MPTTMSAGAELMANINIANGGRLIYGNIFRYTLSAE